VTASVESLSWGWWWVESAVHDAGVGMMSQL